MENPKKFIEAHKLQFAILGIFLTLWLIFYIINPYAFSNPYTYTALLSVTPFTILPALGLTYIIIATEVDLSFSAIMAVGAVTFAYVWQNTGSCLLGFIALLIAGLIAGAFNGILVARLKVPSLIGTIGTMFFWRGIVLVVTGGYGISLHNIEKTYIQSLFVGTFLGVPVQFLWTILITIIFWLILNRHRFGAYVYYIGDNRAAAKMVGINTEKTLLYIFSLEGMIAAFAGFLVALSLGTVWPALGDIYMLKSIAAVVIGGTPLTGGVGTIFGTFMGGLMLDLIETGILAIGVSGFWIKVVDGVVIVIALVAQALIREGELAKIRRRKEALAKE